MNSRAVSLPNLAVSHPNHSEKSRLQLETWSQEGKLFAFVDPFFELPPGIESHRLELRDTDPALYDVIAWDQVAYQPAVLISVDRNALNWLADGLSTERWGLFLISDNKADDLAKYFQKFVIAKGPDGQPYFLRFHDPAVLDVLLNSWDPKERAIFFGPTQYFGLPDLDTMEVHFKENPFAAKIHSLPRPEDCLLQLREPQLKACSDAIEQDLIKVIYWHLRNHHAKSVQYLEAADLQQRVRFAISKARRYSLSTIADLAGFSALMFELAPNFDEHPSFKGVLEDMELAPDLKMRRLAQVITDKEWSEAQRHYDRGFWPSMLPAKKK
jgi:hypothetical protein